MHSNHDINDKLETLKTKIRNDPSVVISQEEWDDTVNNIHPENMENTEYQIVIAYLLAAGSNNKIIPLSINNLIDKFGSDPVFMLNTIKLAGEISKKNNQPVNQNLLCKVLKSINIHYEKYLDDENTPKVNMYTAAIELIDPFEWNYEYDVWRLIPKILFNLEDMCLLAINNNKFEYIPIEYSKTIFNLIKSNPGILE